MRNSSELGRRKIPSHKVPREECQESLQPVTKGKRFSRILPKVGDLSIRTGNELGGLGRQYRDRYTKDMSQKHEDDCVYTKEERSAGDYGPWRGAGWEARVRTLGSIRSWGMLLYGSETCCSS